METIRTHIGSTPIGDLYKVVKIDTFGLWAGEKYEVVYNPDYAYWNSPMTAHYWGLSYPCYANYQRASRANKGVA